VKEDEVNGTCGTHGQMINAYKILVVKPEGIDRFGDLTVDGRVMIK
jgi:hypothetical protein